MIYINKSPDLLVRYQFPFEKKAQTPQIIKWVQMIDKKVRKTL